MAAERAGITRAGEGLDGVVWNILGQTYYPKQSSDTSFAFEAHSPPGTFVPPHIHPDQDEFIYVLEGTIDLRLADKEAQARPGDLVRMPRGVPHAYYNNQTIPSRALFWVTPAGSLKLLFDQLHDLTDVEEVVRRSHACGVDFLPPR